MKILLTAVASAALVAGAATVAFGQAAQTQPNPNTKVYAYQKTETAKKASPAPGAAMAGAQNSPTEQLIGSVPFGSLKWWEVMGRTTSGEGSQ